MQVIHFKLHGAQIQKCKYICLKGCYSKVGILMVVLRVKP